MPAPAMYRFKKLTCASRVVLEREGGRREGGGRGREGEGGGGRGREGGGGGEVYLFCLQ